MIYQIYGFNMVCSCFVEALQEYISDVFDKELPTVSASIVDHLDIDVVDGVKISGDYADAVFTNQVCQFHLFDGVEIRIAPDNIMLSGECIHGKRVGEELNGPSIIVLSRYHKRAVLHGSAFLYNGKAYLVLAYPGAGKSTLSTAMVMYHKDISFLTDDIICVEENGKAMFRGIHSVNLNDDSLHGLMMLSGNNSKVESCIGIDSTKTTCNMSLSDKEKNGNVIPLGGIFLLASPLTNGLIRIQRLDRMQSFCEIMRNIKMRTTMTSDLLMQEMNIINKMIQQDIFIVKLHIEHGYTKLEKITNALREFIDGYN